jgi:hypothetical protein
VFDILQNIQETTVDHVLSIYCIRNCADSNDALIGQCDQYKISRSSHFEGYTCKTFSGPYPPSADDYFLDYNGKFGESHPPSADDLPDTIEIHTYFSFRVTM